MNGDRTGKAKQKRPGRATALGEALDTVPVFRRVALDTSALMAPVQAGVRLFEELDRHLDGPVPVVPTPVVTELRSLGEGAGEEATAAGVGLGLTERCHRVETDATYADDALVELAERGHVGTVVTNDRPLKDRILAVGVPVLCLRGRTELILNRP